MTTATINTVDDLRALPVGTVFDYRYSFESPRYWDYVIEENGIRERQHGDAEGGSLYTWEHIARNDLFRELGERVRIDEAEPEAEVATPEVPEGLTFTEYHPALLPLFAKAAKAANEAGYCSEYDSIAAAIGAPSREEIRLQTSATWTVKVPLTVMVEVEVPATDENEARREVSRVFGSWPNIREHFDAAVGEPGISGWGTKFAENVRGWSGTAPDGYSNIRTTWEARETRPAPTS